MRSAETLDNVRLNTLWRSRDVIERRRSRRLDWNKSESRALTTTVQWLLVGFGASGTSDGVYSHITARSS